MCIRDSMMVSVVDSLCRRCNSSIVSRRRFQTVIAREKDCVCRCVVALVVSAALWTPCVTFQLVDQLGCRLVTQHLESQVIFDIVIRQVSPLVGLSVGLLVPIIYCCRCPSRPGCSTRTTTAFYILNRPQIKANLDNFHCACVKRPYFYFRSKI